MTWGFVENVPFRKIWRRVFDGLSTFIPGDGRYETNIAEGGAGNDTITGGGYLCTFLYGRAGNDSIVGYPSRQCSWLDGGDGHDSISGKSANDQIFGGNGADILNGYAGDDSIYGGNGNDALLGGDGNDILRGENQNDYLRDVSGEIDIDGGNGADEIYADFDIGGLVLGGFGDDRITAISSSDERCDVNAGPGNDTISVTNNSGNDFGIVAGDGRDYVEIRNGSTNVAIDAGRGADFYQLPVAHSNISFVYKDYSDSLSTEEDVISRFIGVDGDEINLDFSTELPLRWATDLRRVGNVVLRAVGQGQYDLDVNCGDPQDIFSIKFRSSSIAREDIRF